MGLRKCPVRLPSYILRLLKRRSLAVDSPNISVVEKSSEVQRSLRGLSLLNHPTFEGGKRHAATIRLSDVFRSGDGETSPGHSDTHGPGRRGRSSGVRHRAIFLRRLLADRLAVQPRGLRALSERQRAGRADA